MPKYFQLDFRLMKIVLYIFLFLCGCIFKQERTRMRLLHVRDFIASV